MVIATRCLQFVVVRVAAVTASNGHRQGVCCLRRSLHLGGHLLALVCGWGAAKSLGRHWRHRLHRGDGNHHAFATNMNDTQLMR